MSMLLLDLGNEPVERRARSWRPLSSSELVDERRRRRDDENGGDVVGAVAVADGGDFSSLRLMTAPMHEFMGLVMSGVAFEDTNLAAIFEPDRLDTRPLVDEW